MKTLEELLTTMTSAEIAQTILTQLAAQTPPLPVTSWQSGSVPSTLVAVFADSEGNLYSGVVNVASGGFLSLASTDWLTLLAYENYGVERDTPRATQGLVQFTDAGGGPYTLTAGVTTVSNGTRTYLVDTTITLPLNGKVFAHVTASLVGQTGNVANGAISTLVTALSGVSVSNVVPWITVYGSASVKTQGYVTLTSTAGGVVGVGACSVQTAAGTTYTNTAAVTLAAGVATEVLFEAAVASVAANVGNGTITIVSVDPLGDITCSNPAPAANTTWVTRAGSDEQTDTSLVNECRNLLVARGVDWIAQGIQYLVAQAPISSGTQITRSVVITNPGGVAGKIGVYIASAAGPVTSGDVSDVQDYLLEYRSLTSTVETISAAARAITITGTAKVPTAYLAQAQAAAAANLAALAANTPIGGDPNADRKIQLEDIVSAIKAASYDNSGNNTNPASPTQLSLAAPSADVALAQDEVPVFTINLTWSAP